jgi:hypothetical protein
MANEKSPHRMLRRATLLLLAAGVCLHLATALFFGGGDVVFRGILCAWSLAPYLLLALVMRRKIRGIGVFFGALVALSIDTNAFWSVFMAPQHSSAALSLLATPFWNLFCVAPLAVAAEAACSAGAR